MSEILKFRVWRHWETIDDARTIFADGPERAVVIAESQMYTERDDEPLAYVLVSLVHTCGWVVVRGGLRWDVESHVALWGIEARVNRDSDGSYIKDPTPEYPVIRDARACRIRGVRRRACVSWWEETK